MSVEVDADGTPIRFEDTACSPIEHHREWIGVLEGEPQRDVWRVQSRLGVCELHYLCQPGDLDQPFDGQWLLARWMD